MTDLPILFSAPMVIALLASRKTQTRRIMKPQPELLPNGSYYVYNRHGGSAWVEEGNVGTISVDYLRIAVGDRLWVREAWRPTYSVEGWREDLGRVAKPSDFDPKTTAIEYLADDERELNGKNRPGIHMPRWASRLTLTVTDVRVQRLQEISEADARDEGCESEDRDNNGNVWHTSARFFFERLWESINGDGSWGANPWVAAYSFDVHKGNIDALATQAQQMESDK